MQFCGHTRTHEASLQQCPRTTWVTTTPACSEKIRFSVDPSRAEIQQPFSAQEFDKRFCGPAEHYPVVFVCVDFRAHDLPIQAEILVHSTIDQALRDEMRSHRDDQG